MLLFVFLFPLSLPGCAGETNDDAQDAGTNPDGGEFETDTGEVPIDHTLHTGLRSSSYGAGDPFPEPEYWRKASTSMASRFTGAVPTLVWIVGELDDEGSLPGCYLNFSSPGGSFPLISFNDSEDENAAYFDLFDKEGIKVWLQVEPGHANMADLIKIVLDRYSGRPCVIGFGVDVEWYKYEENVADEGVAVTDAEAHAWSEQVRSYNPDYGIFFKHWLPEKMPQVYDQGVMFLSDSQGFDSLDGMIEEFELWGQAFYPARVGFQFGYGQDRSWWGQLSDPPGEMGRTFIEKIPNVTDLYWVDFTMENIWPIR
jgi:hypothetical protein